MLRELFGSLGETVGIIAGIAIAPLAYTLGVSEYLVRRAVQAGCRSEEEVRKWLKENA